MPEPPSQGRGGAPNGVSPVTANGQRQDRPQTDHQPRRANARIEDAPPKRLDADFDLDAPKTARGNRVRGPNEALEARAMDTAKGKDTSNTEEDPLPPGAKTADFRTLQDLIARGIHDAEAGATKIEARIVHPDDQDNELVRHRELVRRRREEEAIAREREKEALREKRRREDEQRRRKIAEAMEREEMEEERARNAMQAAEAACQREYAAVVWIQSRIRSRRSRLNKSVSSLVYPATVHAEPWVDQCIEGSRQ